jgi:uncharacterized protein (TIGR01244 family)
MQIRTRTFATAGVLAALSLSVGLAAAPQVVTEDVEGVRNFRRLETTVACAGATNVSATPEIAKMGFRSIINLRLASEPGVDIEASMAAAKAAGIRYYHLPLNGGMPDPAVAAKFIEAITSDGSEPAFIHCAGGNRAATMWMIKRLVVDGWDTERAAAEATALGMTSPVLRQFAIDYAQSVR